jgi:hypothetical protein
MSIKCLYGVSTCPQINIVGFDTSTLHFLIVSAVDGQTQQASDGETGVAGVVSMGRQGSLVVRALD